MEEERRSTKRIGQRAPQEEAAFMGPGEKDSLKELEVLQFHFLLVPNPVKRFQKDGKSDSESRTKPRIITPLCFRFLLDPNSDPE